MSRKDGYEPFSAAALFDAVESEGRYEMCRPVGSLWWSGLAAGLSISFSVYLPMYFLQKLGEGGLAELAMDFGYSVGFVIVVMGRMQLFTENTISTVLPFLNRPSFQVFVVIARLWAIVFFANVVGGTVAAAIGVFNLPESEVGHLVHVAQHGVQGTMAGNLFRAIPAGFLVASIVWLTRASEENELMLVILLTFAIGLGDYAHVIAGSVEVAILVFAEGIGRLSLLWTFLGPALIGNIIGGTGLFALLAYGQVREELDG